MPEAWSAFERIGLPGWSLMHRVSDVSSTAAEGCRRWARTGEIPSAEREQDTAWPTTTVKTTRGREGAACL